MSTFSESTQDACPVNECGCFKIDGRRRLPCESFLDTYYSERHCVNCGHVEASHVRRKPPRKLPDGSWSDGVGRGRPIRDAPRYSAVANPGYQRQCVWKHESTHWVVDSPGSIDKFATHAEAIAYANKVARIVKEAQEEKPLGLNDKQEKK